MDWELYYKMTGKLRGFKSILICISCVLILVMGIVSKYSEIDFKNNAVKAPAEVIGFAEKGLPVISYVADGKEYKVRLNGQVSNAQVGTKLEVKYHKKNPTNVECGENPLNKLIKWELIIGGIGTVAVIYLIYKRLASR